MKKWILRYLIFGVLGSIILVVSSFNEPFELKHLKFSLMISIIVFPCFYYMFSAFEKFGKEFLGGSWRYRIFLIIGLCLLLLRAYEGIMR